MSRLNVCFFSRYGELAPSSRLRYYQFAGALEALGIQASFRPLLANEYVARLYSRGGQDWGQVLLGYARRVASLRTDWEKCDVAVVEKEFFPNVPRALVDWLFGSSRVPVVIDYDDAVYANYRASPVLERKIDTEMRRSYCVVAGNRTIMAYARHLSPRVVYIPTVVDTRRYEARAGYDTIDVPKIGWIGTPVTQPLLETLVPVLTDLAKRRRFRLVVIGGRPGISIPGADVEVVEWSEATETEALRSLDVGVMPLEDTMFTRGKCGYKLVQYMAVGLPTVASPVGANVDIVDHGLTGFLAASREDWVESLDRLLGDAALRASMGRAGRRRVEADLSLESAAARWAEVLYEAAGAGRSTKAA